MTEEKVKGVIIKLKASIDARRVAGINKYIRELRLLEGGSFIYKASYFSYLLSEETLSSQQFEMLIVYASQSSKMHMIYSLADSVLANTLRLTLTIRQRVGDLLSAVAKEKLKKRVTFDMDGGCPIERLVVLIFPEISKAKELYLLLLNNVLVNAAQFNSWSLHRTLYELDTLIEWNPSYENLCSLALTVQVLHIAEDHLGSKGVDEERMISAYCRAGAILKAKANTHNDQAYQQQCQKMLKCLKSRFRMHTRALYNNPSELEIFRIVLGDGYSDQVRSLNGITRKMMGFKVFMEDQLMLTRVARSLMSYVLTFWEKIIPGESYVESYFQVIGAYLDWEAVFDRCSARERIFIVQHCKDHSKYFHLLNQQERRYALEGDLNL
jgi:hypothetical protein